MIAQASSPALQHASWTALGGALLPLVALGLDALFAPLPGLEAVSFTMFVFGPLCAIVVGSIAAIAGSSPERRGAPGIALLAVAIALAEVGAVLFLLTGLRC